MRSASLMRRSGCMARPTQLQSLMRPVGTSRALSAAVAPPKTAIVMMNLGGPATQEEVGPFLGRLFADREIIKMPVPARFQTDWLGPRVAGKRTPKIQEQYQQIGGGSPIRAWTEEQGRGMVELLDELCPESAPHKFYIAFRYASPLTQDALAQMDLDGVERAVAFTQYPQFSCTTTGSSLNEVWRQLGELGLRERFDWSVLDRWPTHEGLVRSFAQQVAKGLEQWPEEERDDVVIMFSAHSIPMMVVNRGDPYPQEVAATVQRVMEELGHSNPYRLVWQSKVGPLPWLGPQTGDVLEGFARIGKKKLLAVPIAFTSDHIETLFEVDIEYKEDAEKLGVDLRRAPSLNAEPEFVAAMADVVAGHLKHGGDGKGGHTTTQYQLRCPGCVNEACGESKAYFRRTEAQKQQQSA